MRLVMLIGLLLFNSIVAISQSPIFQLSFPENEGATTQEEVNDWTLPIQNHFDRPERIEAPFGNALRLDGYSTFISSTGTYNFNDQLSNQMAIEAWYATECFNQSSASLISQISGSGGFQLSINSFGRVVFQIFAEGSSYFILTDDAIPTYRWNHIVAQVDLSEQLATLYLNGEQIGSRNLGDHNQLTFSDSSLPLLVGRANNMPTASGFVTSTLNGAIDELTIYDQTFSPQEILDRYQAIGEQTVELVIDPAIRHQGDYLRPQYHFMPNTLWANEAYGFTYYNDRYHLFFQKNPNASILNFMHWGHLSSPDLVSWEEERIALRPESGFSSVGKWSGTTFLDENDEPVIAFTGVNGSFAGIGIAETQDEALIEWRPIEENPVIERAPTSIPNLDFRDPYVWKEGDLYYMVVGSGKANNGGAILMSYTSTDYKNWTLIPPIFEAPSLALGGRFWEMPYFNRINENDYIFVVTPLFVGVPARTIYWVGSFDGDQFQPYDETPKDFELIQRNLLAPAIGRDEEGRLTYIGIIPEDRNVEDQIEAGWRQTFSVPRVLRLLDDQQTLGQYPHPNLCRARQNEVAVDNRTINSGTANNLPEYQGTQSELYFKLYTGNTNEFSIQFYKNDAGTELTRLVVDKEAGRIGINRVLSSPYNTAEIVQLGDYSFRPDDSLDVRIFLDHSICEVFIDNLVVLSARVYPSENSNNVDIVADDGSVSIVEYRAWDIGDKSETYPETVCLPEDLPSGLFTSTHTLEIIDQPVNAFPNPSSGELTVEVPPSFLDDQYQIRVASIEGKIVFEQNLVGVGNTLEMNLPIQLGTGLYWAQLINNRRQATIFKLFITRP